MAYRSGAIPERGASPSPPRMAPNRACTKDGTPYDERSTAPHATLVYAKRAAPRAALPPYAAATAHNKSTGTRREALSLRVSKQGMVLVSRRRGA